MSAVEADDLYVPVLSVFVPFDALVIIRYTGESIDESMGDFVDDLAHQRKVSLTGDQGFSYKIDPSRPDGFWVTVEDFVEAPEPVCLVIPDYFDKQVQRMRAAVCAL